MAKKWAADEILNLVRAFQPACILTAAVDLNVFTSLRNHPITAQSLSIKLGTDLRATTILLDALVAMDFLNKRKNLYSVPPDIVELLTETNPRNILPAIRHLSNCHRRWAHLSRVVKTGKPARHLPSIRGQAACRRHSGFGASATDQAAFIGAMNIFSSSIVAKIIKRLKPLSFQHLLDIGGASGTWTVAFLRAVPQAKATLFDLPEVIPLAQKRIAQARLSKRVKLIAGDFYKDDLPAGTDFVWLSAVTHQNSRKQNRALFAKVYKALQPGGVLIIRDVVMDKSRTSPVAGALFAVNMLVGTGAGGTYTFDEFQEDLSHVGFTEIKLVHCDQGMNSLIRAKK